MDKLNKATRNVMFSSPLVLVLLSICIFWGKHAQANNELWKAFVLAVTSNIIIFIYLSILALYWRAMRKCERQDEKTE